jgi:hypothetical protein
LSTGVATAHLRFPAKYRFMRHPWTTLPLLLLVPALAACNGEPLGVLAVADGVTVSVLGRGIFDAAYSAAAGKDCSVVRLDKGESYCRPGEALSLAPPPYCTRTLGDVTCWANPDSLNTHPPGIADGPRTLNAAQQRNASPSWLDRLF